MRAMTGDYRQKMEEEKKKQYNLIQNGEWYPSRINIVNITWGNGSGWAEKYWYLNKFSISRRISISTGQSCVWFSKEVCFQSKRKGNNSEAASSRGGLASTKSPNITDRGGNTSLYLCSNNREVLFRFLLIFFPYLNTMAVLNSVLTICIYSQHKCGDADSKLWPEMNIKFIFYITQNKIISVHMHYLHFLYQRNSK